MHTIAFRLGAEDISSDEEGMPAEEQHQISQRIVRRQLRDASNPLELPQTLFHKYYRVNKPAFRYLLDLLIQHTQQAKKLFSVSPVVKLSACLSFFAEGGYQTGVSKDCDVSIAQSTFCKVLAEVVDVFLNHLCPAWIKVPVSEDEKRKIALEFYRKYKIPCVVGCRDGTHVQIIAPADNKHLFYNRKGKYSLNVLLVCDHELKIRYVDSSHPGTCHDSFVWNTSDLRIHFEQKYLQGDNNFWLLGDAGYPLEPWLLTPNHVPEDGSPEMKFNEAHSKCRNIIECTNGVLKNRWRCLLGARELHYSPEKAAKIVNVCCALHNLCIHFKVKDIPGDFLVLSMPEDEIVQPVSSQYQSVAQSIRSNIARTLH